MSYPRTSRNRGSRSFVSVSFGSGRFGVLSAVRMQPLRISADAREVFPSHAFASVSEETRKAPLGYHPLIFSLSPIFCRRAPPGGHGAHGQTLRRWAVDAPARLGDEVPWRGGPRSENPCRDANGA